MKKLSKDEEKVLATIRKRFEHGRREYGRLELDTDRRGFVKEALEEILDMSLYIAMKLEKIRMEVEVNEKNNATKT
jgi:hypothetical protein